MTLKNIVWLASYPKSGNTWVRIFLANFVFNPPQPMPINQVHRIGMGDAIATAYKAVCKGPFDPADRALTLSLRNRVLRRIVNNEADVNFVKSHNIRGRAHGQVLIPDRYSKSAVYIVRDPRDMVISYARHYNSPVDRVIASIGRGDNAVKGGGAVTQYLGSWSDHVKAWTEPARPGFPLLVLRYEDMLDAPEDAFGKLIDFTGIALGDDARLRRAIRFASIGEMKKQEKAAPFIERPKNSETFFTRGTQGHWREILTKEQAAKIESQHGATMRKFGYLR